MEQATIFYREWKPFRTGEVVTTGAGFWIIPTGISGTAWSDLSGLFIGSLGTMVLLPRQPLN